MMTDRFSYDVAAANIAALTTINELLLDYYLAYWGLDPGTFIDENGHLSGQIADNMINQLADGSTNNRSATLCNHPYLIYDQQIFHIFSLNGLIQAEFFFGRHRGRSFLIRLKAASISSVILNDVKKARALMPAG